MQDQAATVDEGGDKGSAGGAAALGHSAEPKGHAMKFAFPSGARPLEGFTIKRGIGRGGFGEVYYATSDAGKEVALKHIQRNLDVELRGVGQCLNLKHPNLLSLFDIKYDEGGAGWVVMEYVAGESLKDVIDRNPNGLPLDVARFWFQGICAGVASLHDHGIVHRDLKPGNIFNDEGIVKIGDYGLSKFISVSRRSGQTESVGTFHYMAPEIGQGRYGKEIDIYALGIILYELLTGRVPFEGESSQEIIMKHLTAEPDLSGIQQPYAGVITRALAKDPDNRIHSVSDLLRPLGLGGDSHADGSLASSAGRPVAAAVTPRPSTPPAPSKPDLVITDSNAEMVFGPVHEKPVSATLCDVPATQGPREPVAEAMHDGWKAARDWWNHAPLGALGKFVLLLAAVFLLVTNAAWLLPTALVLALVYVAYRFVWTLVADNPGKRPEHEPRQKRHDERNGTRPDHRRRPRHTSTRKRLEWLRSYLGRRPAHEKFAELIGSMLMSAFVAAVLGLVMMIVGGRSMQGAVYAWGPFYVWLVVAATAGSWAVLIPAKLWEGRDDAVTGSSRTPRGEQVLRRFSMLVVGLLVGWLAFALGSLLMVDLSVGEATLRPVFGDSWSTSMFAANGAPLLPAFLAYFAGIFVVLRWWRQADPLRTTRLSLWATAVAAGWAFLLHLVWPFPQPWGFMLAMTISLAVQLSTPWLSPARRVELQRAMEDA
jgi:hypothetical protein